MTDIPTSIQLVSDAELIAELRSRGKVTIIGMAKHDPDAGATGNQILFSLTYGGDAGHALGMAAMMLRGLSKKCRELGMAENDIHSILAEAAQIDVPVR